MTAAILTLVTLSQATAATEPPVERRAIDRVSETLTSDNEAWKQFGFRIQVGLSFEQLRKTATPSPDGGGVGPSLHLGARLNERWSLLAGLRYSILKDQMTGVRFTATAEGMFHVVWGLSAGLGLGYGGMAGGMRRAREIEYAQYFDDPAPIDISGAEAPATRAQRFNRCEGSGVAVLGRVQYLMTVGDVFSTGPELRLEHQWTRCTDDNMRAWARDDLQKLPTQWWSQRAFAYGWVLAWR